MLDEQRKKELVIEFVSDVQHYLDSADIEENFIDATCRTPDEVEFIRNLDWGVAVYE